MFRGVAWADTVGMTETNRNEWKTISAFLISLVAAGLLYFAALAAWVSGCCGSPNGNATDDQAITLFVFGSASALAAAVFAAQLLRRR